MNVPTRFRIVSAGFVIGALTHVVELSSRFLSAWRPDYPVWRHGLFIVLDSGLAVLAVMAPTKLWLPLTAFLLQQTYSHGGVVWATWQHEHRLAWIDALVVAFIAAATLAAVAYRWRSLMPRPRDTSSSVAAG